MTILDYTDIPTIRALLGVNTLELRDATLMLPPYLLAVQDRLDLLNEQVSVRYFLVKDVPEATRTVLQMRYYNQVQTYSALAAAIEVMPTLPMAAPKSIEDGKAKLDRIADPYTALADSLEKSLSVIGLRILDTLGKLDPTVLLPDRVVRNFAGVAALGVDPVTGA